MKRQVHTWKINRIKRKTVLKSPNILISSSTSCIEYVSAKKTEFLTFTKLFIKLIPFIAAFYADEVIYKMSITILLSPFVNFDCILCHIFPNTYLHVPVTGDRRDEQSVLNKVCSIKISTVLEVWDSLSILK